MICFASLTLTLENTGPSAEACQRQGGTSHREWVGRWNKLPHCQACFIPCCIQEAKLTSLSTASLVAQTELHIDFRKTFAGKVYRAVHLRQAESTHWSFGCLRNKNISTDRDQRTIESWNSVLSDRQQLAENGTSLLRFSSFILSIQIIHFSWEANVYADKCLQRATGLQELILNSAMRVPFWNYWL